MTKTVTFRLDSETLDNLEYLADISGDSRTGVLKALVNAKADSARGNPVLRDDLEKLRQIQSLIRELKI
jgi:hypothetical protein